MVYDYAVIGGGVVGSAIFNKLVRVGRSCVLLEKNNDVSCGISKGNSGIIHAGFDAVPNTLKAKLNVRGNKMMAELCSQLNVKYINNGALVVGNDIKRLESLKARGKENKVDGLEILNKQQLQKLVPSISGDINYALHAKTSGIVLPYELTIALAEEALLNGGVVKLEFEVVKITHDNNIYSLYSSNNDKVAAKYVINASAMNFNKVSKLIGAETYPITFRTGEYFLLDKDQHNLTKYTVFPMPTDVTKGVLVSPTVDGNILVGPNSLVIEDYNPETSITGMREVKESAIKSFPEIKFNKNIRNFAGVRTVVGDDFVIEKSKLKPNLINIAGICSPGLTAAPAIAEMVVRELLEISTPEKKMIERKGINTINDKTINQVNQLIKTDKNYGVIVCRCENVSLAEIIQAINSPLKPKSADAIKRRTRAGMGRCQGSYCLYSVINEIAKQHNMPIEMVNKENAGSKIIVGDIKKLGGV